MAQVFVNRTWPAARSPPAARRSLFSRRTSASFSSGVPVFTLPQCLRTSASSCASSYTDTCRTCSSETAFTASVPSSIARRSARADGLRLRTHGTNDDGVPGVIAPHRRQFIGQRRGHGRKMLRRSLAHPLIEARDEASLLLHRWRGVEQSCACRQPRLVSLRGVTTNQ